MTEKERTKYEQMAINYLADILREAENWAIDFLDKEVKENWEVEVTLTYGGPTVRLDLKDNEVIFNFSYQPFEYSELITDRELIEKIKQAI